MKEIKILEMKCVIIIYKQLCNSIVDSITIVNSEIESYSDTVSDNHVCYLLIFSYFHWHQSISSDMCFNFEILKNIYSLLFVPFHPSKTLSYYPSPRALSTSRICLSGSRFLHSVIFSSTIEISVNFMVSFSLEMCRTFLFLFTTFSLSIHFLSFIFMVSVS